MTLFETLADITRPEILTEKEFHEEIFNEAYKFAIRNRRNYCSEQKEEII